MKLQVVLLSVAVILAGCVGQPSALIAADGVIIKSFTANPSEVESRAGEAYLGTITIATAVIQNVGEMDAESVTVKLTGLSPEWGFKPAGIANPICRTQAFIAVGEFREQTRYADICRYFGVGKLSPADLSRGLEEGEEAVVEWELSPPPRKEVDQTYEAGIRLNYQYTTVFDSLIRIVSSSYFRQTNNKGGVVTAKFSKGPLAVDIKTTSFIFPEATQSVVPLQVEINNVGNGRVFQFREADKERIIREPSVDDLDLIGVTVNLGSVDVTGECKLIDGNKARLINGKSGVILCKIPIPSELKLFADKSITFKFTYNYLVDSKTTIRVLPIIK